MDSGKGGVGRTIPLGTVLGFGGHGDEVSVRVVPWTSWALSRIKFAIWPYGLIGAILYAALFAQAVARGRLAMFLLASVVVLPSTLGLIWVWNSRRVRSPVDEGQAVCTIVGPVSGLTSKESSPSPASSLQRHRLQLTGDGGAVLGHGLSRIPLRDRDMRAVIQVTRSGRVRACEFHGTNPTVTVYAIGRLDLGTGRP